MSTLLVLGYRPGLDEAITRHGGLRPFFVVERVKRQLAGREYAQVSDIEDAQEVLRAVQARGIDDVHAVVTGHEEAVFTTALLRSHFDAPGDRDFGRTLRFRDKFLQKRALPASIPRALCEYVTPDAKYDDVVAELGEPFVIKPANGFGSARTSVIRSPEDLASYWDDSASGSDVRVVAESFVGGAEIHVDGVWQDGHLAWSSLSCYADAPITWNTGGILADAQVSREKQPELYAQADGLTEQALRGLDAPDTVFHLEAFRPVSGEHAGQLVFGECASRIGGAMVPEIVALTHGVNLYDAVLSLALGEPTAAAEQARTPEHYYGYVFLRRVPGVDVTEDDFRATFGDDMYEVDFPTDPDAPTGAYGRNGHALVRHRDSDRVQELLVEVVSYNLTGRPPQPGQRSSGHA